MNKIKHNKFLFLTILASIFITFTSLSFLSLPVLFNYKSVVKEIEKNFYKKFKIYLKSSGAISYKPFPKPHLLIEKAEIRINKNSDSSTIRTDNLKLYLPLKNIYRKSTDKIISVEIFDTNINFKFKDIIYFREHLYKKINDPIIIKNSKFFLMNDENEVIIISPIKTINYKINEKLREKKLIINGNIFDINFEYFWKKNYLTPNLIESRLNTISPNIQIENFLDVQNPLILNGSTDIKILKDKLNLSYSYLDEEIYISSKNKKNSTLFLNSQIKLDPFYSDSEFIISNKSINAIIDNFLIFFFNYDKNYLGNLNGKLRLSFKNIKNTLIKNGQFNFSINEKKIEFLNSFIEVEKIGIINSKIKYFQDQGQLKFISYNTINIDDHIEFAKAFQLSSKKTKKLKKIYFDLVKNIDDGKFIVKNIRINNDNNLVNFDEPITFSNFQAFKASLRKIIN